MRYKEINIIFICKYQQYYNYFFKQSIIFITKRLSILINFFHFFLIIFFILLFSILLFIMISILLSIWGSRILINLIFSSIQMFFIFFFKFLHFSMFSTFFFVVFWKINNKKNIFISLLETVNYHLHIDHLHHLELNLSTFRNTP